MIEPDQFGKPLSGIELSRLYHRDVVRPIVLGRWPDLPFAAGRLGQGSDVLGLDDGMSADHDWGLRLTLLVPDGFCAPVRELLDAELPESFLGHPIRFVFTGSQVSTHHVDVDTPSGFAVSQLGFHPCQSPTVFDWLSVTGQAVLEVVGGPLFEDRLHEPTEIRACLSWYPDDIWRYLVACDWARIDEELPLMSRAGHRGDDLGSRVIAARIADRAIHLAFLLRRSWAPYSKWRGALFLRLGGVEPMANAVSSALDARTWEDRQSAIGQVLDELLRIQASTELEARPASACEPFYDRPYLRVETSIVGDLMSTIRTPIVRALPLGLGSIEQQSDNVAVLTNVGFRRKITGDTEVSV